MKVLSFGSLNYDHVYQMDHFVLPGETMAASDYQRGFGGKGLNQSIALAKAGLEVWHAGMVGFDGQPFIDYLNHYGVHTDYLVKNETIATGHAIIEVCNAQNRIVLYGGANQAITPNQIDETLSHFDEGDYLIIQNEISNLPYLIQAAKAKGMMIFFNAAPMDEKVPGYPLDLVDILCVNEIEGAALAGYASAKDGAAALIEGTERDTARKLMDRLHKQYPDLQILLTYGDKGSYYQSQVSTDLQSSDSAADLQSSDSAADLQEPLFVPAKEVTPVDTTAAGDTYSGYYLAGIASGMQVKEAMELATIAASMTVQKPGAADAIPDMMEVKRLLN